MMTQLEGEHERAQGSDEHSVPLLRATRLTKAFAGTVVVDAVDLEVQAGQVVAVVGENGAGKSTLKNMLCGLLSPDTGVIELEGKPIAHFRGVGLGIAAVHQEFSLFGGLSVAENVCMSDLPGSKPLVNWREVHAVARQYMDSIGAHIDLDAPVETLSTGEQQLVEIAKALRQASRLLILDEPTASLTEPERERLFAVIRTLRERGLGIIFISHFIDEVYEIADAIAVLRDGRCVAQRPSATLPRRELEELMVGRPVSERQLDIGIPGTDIALRVEHLTSEPAFTDVSFELHQGEILGWSGLMGAGRTEVVEAVYGLRPAEGRVWVGDRLVHHRSPAALKRLGVAFVPEDRRRYGLFDNRMVRENLTAALIAQLVRRWLPGFGFQGEKEQADASVKDLHIVHPGLEAPVRLLSGGNQQKALLGRWLAIAPRVCIFDEPTRGVDIGAKEEIHARIARLACAGTAVLLVSSDLPELLQLAHRIIVLRKGRVAAEFRRAEFDVRAIIERSASAIVEE
jgi:ABC-type sugar transport system ATPase subunit